MGCCNKETKTDNCCSDGKADIANCMVCDSELIYKSQPVDKECYYCGEEKPATIYCTDHFICDSCHNQEINQVIESAALKSETKNPIEFAERMMAHPNMPFLGGAHHLVITSALLVALKNNESFQIEGSTREVTNADIKEGIRRMKKVPSSSCADYGSCGVGPGVGAVFSILYQATCAKDRERTLTMRATNATLTAVTNKGGPGCCKQSLRTALEVGIELLKEHFGVQLPVSRICNCKFPAQHPHSCKGEACVYFGAKVSARA
jgi:hypothetical protein